jgi:thiamine biosynthesis protein ThiI
MDGADAILIHYADLGLKRSGRSHLERELLKRVNRALRPLGAARARLEIGRMTVSLGEASPDEAVDALGRVPGIAWFAVMHRLPREMKAFKRAAVDLTAADTGSFRVTVKRADRRFPVTSMEIARQMGAAIVEATGRKVDLEGHDHNYCLEISERGAYFYTERRPGLGGLPSGTNGDGIVLLSGGIGSALAAVRMICRGVIAHPLHFHHAAIAPPDRAADRPERMAAALSRLQGEVTLETIDFGPVQDAVVEAVEAELRAVVHRRMMHRIADRLRRARGWPVLVTGDVVGQAASQTLENLEAVLMAAPAPVLTPVAGVHQDALLRAAEDHGLAAIARLPYEDVVHHRAVANPGRHTGPEHFAEAEAAFDVERLVAEAVARVESVSFRHGEVVSAESPE